MSRRSSSREGADDWTDKEDAANNTPKGIDMNENIQGFPLQYDISLTEQGRIGAFLNFGQDFDVY
jgi:hypothetical protein